MIEYATRHISADTVAECCTCCSTISSDNNNWDYFSEIFECNNITRLLLIVIFLLSWLKPPVNHTMLLLSTGFWF